VARSRRHVPIIGCAAAASEKLEKQAASRSLRRIVREKLRTVPEADVLPTKREVSDVWVMAKDGKVWAGPDARAEWMRK